MPPLGPFILFVDRANYQRFRPSEAGLPKTPVMQMKAGENVCDSTAVCKTLDLPLCSGNK